MFKIIIVLLFSSQVLWGQDSLNVTKIGEVWDYWNQHWNLHWSPTAADTLCLISTRLSGLRILDTSNPAEPVEIGHIEIPGGAYKSARTGSIAYVGCGVGLQIVDFSDPRNPTQLSLVNLQALAYDVAVLGDFVYISCGDRVRIVDVQDLHNPIEVGAIDSLGLAAGLATFDNRLFVTGHYWDELTAYMRLYDLSDPVSPIEIGSCSIPSYTATEVQVIDTLAYVAAEDGMVIVDVSEPELPVQISFEFGVFATDIVVGNNVAYVHDWLDGLNIYDVSVPESPQLIYTWNVMGQGVALHEDVLYVCAYPRTLEVLDVSDPSNPLVLSQYEGRCCSYSIAQDGDVVLSLDREYGVQVIDVSDPSQPVVLSIFETGASAICGVLRDTLAFVAEDQRGIAVLNLADPNNPAEIGLASFPSSVEDIAIQGDFAYTVHDRGWAGDLQITNIADPTNPSNTGFLQIWDATFLEVAVAGNFATIAAGDDGFYVVDISDPSLPVVVGHYDTHGSAFCVAATGHYVYIGDHLEGVKVFDISNPAAPDSIGWWDTPGSTQSISLSGDRVFIADNNRGIEILDFSNPEDPILAGYYDTNGGAIDVAIRDSIAFVADASTLSIFDVSLALAPYEVSVPESLLIQYRPATNDIRLSWQPVTTTVHGFPVTIDHYLIYRSSTWSPDVWEDVIIPTPRDATEFIDTVPSSGKRFYKVAAFAE